MKDKSQEETFRDQDSVFQCLKLLVSILLFNFFFSKIFYFV